LFGKQFSLVRLLKTIILRGKHFNPGRSSRLDAANIRKVLRFKRKVVPTREMRRVYLSWTSRNASAKRPNQERKRRIDSGRGIYGKNSRYRTEKQKREKVFRNTPSKRNAHSDMAGWKKRGGGGAQKRTEGDIVKTLLSARKGNN